MNSAGEDIPNDITALKAALIGARDECVHAEAELAVARAKASDDQVLIVHQQLQIAKLTRQLYGVGEDGITAFTSYGIECLKQIITDEKAAATALTSIKTTEQE